MRLRIAHRGYEEVDSIHVVTHRRPGTLALAEATPAAGCRSGLHSQDGEAVPDETKQAVLALIREQRAQGKSLREIVAALEAGASEDRSSYYYQLSAIRRRREL